MLAEFGNSTSGSAPVATARPIPARTPRDAGALPPRIRWGITGFSPDVGANPTVREPACRYSAPFHRVSGKHPGRSIRHPGPPICAQ